jgi:hypothetical protein
VLILRLIPRHLGCWLLAEVGFFEAAEGLTHALLGCSVPQLCMIPTVLLLPE